MKNGSDDAEHVIVGAHLVVVHEQLESKDFAVEVGARLHISMPRLSKPTQNTVTELKVNAARTSKPGNISTELTLWSEKDKPIMCGCFPQSYEPYEVCEKTWSYFTCFAILVQIRK